MKQKTKKNFSICIDNNLYELVEKKMNNKSKYIEWLIYQDLLKESSDKEDVKKIIL